MVSVITSLKKSKKKKKTTIERAPWKDNSKTDKNTNKVY